MVSRIIFISIFLTITGYCFAQKTKSPYQHDNFFGKVKLVVESGLNESETQAGQLRTDTLILDSSRYNANGELAERVFYSSIGNNKLGFNSKYVYISKFDEKGNKIETALYKNSKIVGFYYDAKGNMTTLEGYFPDGKLSYRNRYLYDGNGNQVVENSFNDKDSLKTVRKYIFDNKGNATQQNNYYADSRFNNTVFYNYTRFDQKGNWLERHTIVKLKNRKQSKGIKTIRQIIYY